MSPTNQKVLLLLLGGVALGCTYLPHRQKRVLHEIGKEWKRIDRQNLQRNINSLYKSKLLTLQQLPNGDYTYILSSKGRSRALTYKFQGMRITKGTWDKKWRFVSFDVPEVYRKGRDALRAKLRNLGFIELQKSVFVFPYECSEEIKFLIEFFGMEKYVRFGTIESIDNDIKLRQIFKLL